MPPGAPWDHAIQATLVLPFLLNAEMLPSAVGLTRSVNITEFPLHTILWSSLGTKKLRETLVLPQRTYTLVGDRWVSQLSYDGLRALLTLFSSLYRLGLGAVIN